MSDIWKLLTEGGIAFLEITSPPVNALGHKVRQGLLDGIAQAEADTATRAIVLICGGSTFFAGADIAEFGRPPVPPNLADVFEAIENCSKPLIAAMHGTALGGGCELALVCHYRIATPSTKMGLPEINLGIIPGAGGTQRLPRIVGPEKALALILSGKPISAAEALDLGMIDALAGETTLRQDAVAFAGKVLAEGKPLIAVRNRNEKVVAARGRTDFLDAARKDNAKKYRGFRAPEMAVQAIEAAIDLPFDQGLKRERALFLQLRDSTESAAQRHYFFAERGTSKVPDVPRDTPTRAIATVGVIGAGTMGGGISMAFLNAGIPVTLVEMNQAALDRGQSAIRKNYERSASSGRITRDQVEQRMALLTPVIGLESLADVDLVIEAVFEEMAVKKEIFGKLDTIAKQGAILASNTSFLDLDEIARATERPESVIGLHFFSPANIMRLLEIVRGEKTSPEVVATALKLARTIAKVPVVSRVCPGFIANRIMSQRGRQAERLVLEGAAPAAVDKVLYDYGFAMGPFQMVDLVGLDVLGRDIATRTLRGDFVQQDRLGQKKNAGFYDYDENRKPVPSPVAAEIIASFARHKGIQPKAERSAADLLAEMLYPVVNEGAKLLDEGIALRAADIDVACVLGYNWPVYTGGPMCWADTVGLERIVATLRELEAEHGAEFAPAPLLIRMAEEGGRFTHS